MAQYTITYRCGHEGTTNVTGAPEKRERQLTEQREGLCIKCAQQAKLAELQASGDQVAADAYAATLQRGKRRAGVKALQDKYGFDAADRIAQKHGFASNLQR